MSNRNNLLHTFIIEQLNHILRHKRTSIFHWVRGDTSPTITEHIRNDEAISSGFKEGDLATPVVGGRGEAVEEEEVGFSWRLRGTWRREIIVICDWAGSGEGFIEGRIHGSTSTRECRRDWRGLDQMLMLTCLKVTINRTRVRVVSESYPSRNMFWMCNRKSVMWEMLDSAPNRRSCMHKIW